MEFMIDYDILGEILLPLTQVEIGKPEKEKEAPPMTYKELKEKKYYNFRSVLLQGELIKFYVLLKCNRNDVPNEKEILSNLYFKIEFESTETSSNDQSENDEAKKAEYEKTLSDLFTINSDKLNVKNQGYESIVSKQYDEENHIMLYEVYKQIIVPKNLLEYNLIMKLNLLTKNEVIVSNDLEPLDYYQSGYYNNVEEFKMLKTLFKEVRIIRPLNISETKQVDVLIDMSLLQATIENKTSHIDFIDSSLQFSKFITNKAKDEEFTQNKGIDININEIQILKDETALDENLTSNLEKIKEIYMKKDKINLANISFSLYNTELPVIIRPGEEYNLTLKVIKSAFVNEKSENKKTIQTQNSLQPPGENQSETSSTFAENQILKSSRTLTQQSNNEGSSINSLARQSTVIPTYAAATTTANLQSLPSIQYNVTNFGPANQKNIFMQTKNTQTNEEPEGEEDNFDTQENFKIYFTTPIILRISSDIFYECLYMCIQMKWNNEINRFLKVEINIPKEIYLHEYFEVALKCRNISSGEMNLCIEISDNFEDMKMDDEIDLQAKNVEIIPSILSQTKFQNFGIFNCSEDKIFVLKFLALKKGFSLLPSFVITDTLTNKRFFVSQSNKILVKEKNE